MNLEKREFFNKIIDLIEEINFTLDEYRVDIKDKNIVSFEVDAPFELEQEEVDFLMYLTEAINKSESIC